MVLRTPLLVMERPAPIITPPKVPLVAIGNEYPLGTALICPLDAIVILVPSILTPPKTVVDA